MYLDGQWILQRADKGWKRRKVALEDERTVGRGSVHLHPCRRKNLREALMRLNGSLDVSKGRTRRRGKGV